MDELREEFYKDDKNRLAQNVVSRSDPLETCMSRISIEETQHVFNNKVDEVKPVTSQKSSGRCWIFAVMNAMRIPFMKKLEIEDFEFSQSYLFFWDKIERSNYFLNTIGKYLQIVTRVCPKFNLNIYIFQPLFTKEESLLMVVWFHLCFTIPSMTVANGIWLRI